MTEIPDDEVEAAARAFSGYSPEQYARWQHTSKGQRWNDMARAALAAVRPRWEKQLAELHSDVGALKEGFNRVSYQLGTVEAERDDARAELERVRAAANDALARAEDTARRIPSPFADNVVFAVRAALRQLAEPKEGES